MALMSLKRYRNSPIRCTKEGQQFDSSRHSASYLAAADDGRRLHLGQLTSEHWTHQACEMMRYARVQHPEAGVGCDEERENTQEDVIRTPA